MSQIGEVKRGSELGYINPITAIRKFTYVSCPSCRAERWCQTPKANDGKCGKCAWSESGIKQRLPSLLDFESKRVGRLVRYKDACSSCSKELWRVKSMLGHLCWECYTAKNRGINASNWRGGRVVDLDGYVMVLLQPDDPYFLMADKRHHRVFEHRLVMAHHLGRCLKSWEIVHHKGTKYPMSSKEDKGDNRIENLELLPNNVSNITYARMEERICKLETQNTNLEKQVKLLLWHIKDLQQGNPEPSLLKEHSSKQEGVETKAERVQLNNAYKRPTSLA